LVVQADEDLFLAERQQHALAALGIAAPQMADLRNIVCFPAVIVVISRRCAED
jgi:hypothetical protein